MAVLYCTLFLFAGKYRASGSASAGGMFHRCGMKDSLYNGRPSLPEDCDFPNTTTMCPYVISADDAFPLGRHVKKPYGGRYFKYDK